MTGTLQPFEPATVDTSPPTGLRHRSIAAERVFKSTGLMASHDDENDGTADSVVASGLALPHLLKAFPQEHGHVQKLHIPVLFMLLPSFIQRFILLYIPLLRQILAPRWRDRYLILVGSYLYKFPARAATMPETKQIPPKGSPIPVTAITQINILDVKSSRMDSDPICNTILQLESLSSHDRMKTGRVYFSLERFGKIDYFAASNHEQASTWVVSLQTARQESITRDMGHAPSDSFPAAWKYYDTLGRQLVRSKERVKARIESTNLRDMEMTSLTSAGGGSTPLPRGYFG